MTKVGINCPTCNGKGRIEISDDAMKNVSRGLLAINIAEQTICEHSFIAYVDKNFNVRDYFIADFQVDIPDISPKERIKDSIVPSKEVIDIDLIKLNFHAIILTYVLESIFLKQKIIIISDQEFLYQHIQNFFNFITKNAFEVDLTLLSEEDYHKNKKKFKDYMVFNSNFSNEIVRNNKKLINPKKLEIEKHIVNRFFSEGELGFSYIFLKNEIFKAYELSKSIVAFINEEKKKGNKVNILRTNKNIEDEYDIKINPTYLNFLINIVEHYFGISVPSISTSFIGSL